MNEKRTTVEDAVKANLGAGAAVVERLAETAYPASVVEHMRQRAARSVVHRLVAFTRRKS